MTGPTNAFETVQAALGGFKAGIDGTEAGLATPAEVSAALNGLRSSTTENAATLADLVTASGAGVVGHRSLIAPDGTGSGFGPGWVTGGDSAIERADDMWRWVRSGTTMRRAWGIATADGPTLSNYQALRLSQTSAVETPVWWGFYEGAANMLIARSNSDATKFVTAVFGRQALMLWQYDAPTWTPLESWAITDPPPGAVGAKELIAGTVVDEREFVINFGGARRSWTDTGAVTELGDDYRYGGMGFISDARQSLFPSETIPGSVSVLGIRDNEPTGVVGTGFRVSRADNTTDTLALSASEIPLSDDWFDTTDYCSADILWDPVEGVVTILREGHYVFQWGAVMNSASSGAYASMMLARSGFPTADVHTVDLDPGRLGGTPLPYAATFYTYVGPGEYLQPQLAGSGNAVLRGESSGVRTFFSGALVNPG